MFVAPNLNLQLGDPNIDSYIQLTRKQLRDRWKTPEGKEILESWKASEFDYNSLAGLIGKIYSHYDLRGIDLSNENLEGKNLSNIDFFASNFNNANLSRANLRETYLSESSIEGAKFDWAIMDGVLIDNASFNRETSFYGVNLEAINFTLAVLLRDLILSQQRIEDLKNRYPKFAWLLKITSDYGRSVSRWGYWCIGIIIVFALLYYCVPSSTSAEGCFNCLYFSFVTFTTLGYGDFVPISSLGQIFVIIEVSLGYVMGGLLVAILTRKILV